ncbi:MAG: hypothetical protein SF123_25560 [Chloroflexota bacterium]|nr:hypothetical protein [Chloroflexota bacterium]
MRRSSALYVVSWITLCLCFSVFHLPDVELVQAQSARVQRVFSSVDPGGIGGYPSTIVWSADSRNIVFDGDSYGYTLVERSQGEGFWQSYDVTTQQLARTTRWPLQPMLTSSERLAMGERENFAFVSPNGEFAVFAGARLADYTSPLLLSNRTTGTIQTLGTILLFPLTSDAVLWSQDSISALIAVQTPVEYLAFQLVNFANPVNPLVLWFNITNDGAGQGHIVHTLLDLSDDGTRALIRIPVIGTMSPQFRLASINMSDPTQTEWISSEAGNQVFAAAFRDDDESTILVASELGIVQLDIATNTTQILITDPILAERGLAPRVQRVGMFSPDTNWFAFHTEREVYVVDLTTVLPPPSN